jgi:hypothetical protein
MELAACADVVRPSSLGSSGMLPAIFLTRTLPETVLFTEISPASLTRFAFTIDLLLLNGVGRWTDRVFVLTFDTFSHSSPQGWRVSIISSSS